MSNSRKKIGDSAGFGMLEALIALAILVLMAGILGAVFTQFITVGRASIDSAEANSLLEEAKEAVSYISYTSWSDISSKVAGHEYEVSRNGEDWTLLSAGAFIDTTFLRTVTFADVYRDAQDDIAESGTLDPDTRRVNISVSWNQGGRGTTTKQFDFYVHNLF